MFALVAARRRPTLVAEAVAAKTGKPLNISRILASLEVSLLLTIGVAACEKPGPGERAGKAVDQTVDEAGQKIAGTAAKAQEEAAKAGAAVDDTAVTARIKAAFLAESGLKTLQISVDTVKGVVTLSGSVATQAQSDLASTMASGVSGVSRVTNKLVIGTGQ